MTMLIRHWTEARTARKHTSPWALGRVWPHSARWIIATTKQVYPIVVVFAIFAAVVAATIALRLAIWLPLYYRH